MQSKKPRNFVILFHSREGSSAIISTISRLNGVHVPVFEEFDKYAMSKRHPDLDVLGEIDKAFSRQPLGVKLTRAFENHIHSETSDSVACVGFKWRLHSPHNDVIRLFQKHDVQVVRLYRANLFELTCSYYFSRKARRERLLGEHSKEHPQFRYSSMSKERKEQLSTAIEQTKVSLNPITFYMIMARRVQVAWRYRRFAARAKRSGVRTSTICYEDFVNDPMRFLERFAESIGLSEETVPAKLPEIRFQKLSNKPASSRIKSKWLVGRNPLTKILNRLYAKATSPV